MVSCQVFTLNKPGCLSHKKLVKSLHTVPTPRLSIVRFPSDILLYTTTQVNITCLVELNSVDSSTDVSVDWGWSGPGTRTLNNTVDISESHLYESSLTISSLQSADSGTYTCSFSVSSPSPYIVESDEVSASTTFQAG